VNPEDHSTFTEARHARSLPGGNMKKLISLFVFAVCVSAPSFGAEHILSRSAKVVGKDSYKVTKTSLEDLGKGGDTVVKFIF
jgi:hypothetical protein